MWLLLGITQSRIIYGDDKCAKDLLHYTCEDGGLLHAFPYHYKTKM